MSPQQMVVTGNSAAAELLEVAPTAPVPAVSPLASRAVTALVVEGGVDALRRVERVAAAFASGQVESRRASLARSAAVQEELVQQLTAMLGAAVARGNEGAARLLDRLVTSANNRYLGLLNELHHQSAPSRRITMVARGAIAVNAEEQ